MSDSEKTITPRITDYETQYMKALIKIASSGYRDGNNERTGMATRRLPGIVISMDVEKEFPILHSKKVFYKSALDEILWIWQRQSNNIKDLKPHIWDSWADENGSIGKAYGYQIGQEFDYCINPLAEEKEMRHYKSMANFVLEYLREFPNGRQCVVTLWNAKELKDMRLCPCCHTTTWNLDGGRLNCVLDQRSGDFPYGVPFDQTQYAMLMILFARALNVKPGILTHVIADAHIYENQMEGVTLQSIYFDTMISLLYGEEKEAEKYAQRAANLLNQINERNTREGNLVTETTANHIITRATDALLCDTHGVYGGEETDFFEMDPEKFVVTNYNHMGVVKFGDIAV